MKKSVSRVIVSLATVVAVTVANAAPANASITVTNGGKGFTSAWECSASAESGKAVLIYGHNTAFFNEDYAHAYHSTAKHYARVKNGKGTFSGTTQKRNVWSKIEVLHNGKSVTYSNIVK